MRHSILTIAVLSILSLGLGPGPAALTLEASSGPTLMRASLGLPQDQPETARILQSTCVACHELMDLQDYGYTEADWNDLLQRMIGYGAILSDSEYNTLLAYLVSGASGEETTPPDAGAAPGPVNASGKTLFETVCTTCHDTTAITDNPGIYGAEDYRDIVNNMIDYGAPLDTDQTDQIVGYLTATYGRTDQIVDAEPDARPAGGPEGADLDQSARLFETACTTCHDVSSITEYPGTYTEAEFRDTVVRMLDYGAELTADDAEAVIEYLTVTYGRD